MSQFLGYALLLACLCLLAAAVIPTVSWFQCTSHAGGVACTSAAQGAREGWLTAANVLLGLVIQDGRRRP
jgi:hypothetical protein